MIETERLILRCVTREDLDLYTAILGDADLTRYLPKGRPYTAAEIEDHVEARCRHWDKGFGSYVMVPKTSPKKRIGYAGIETVAQTVHRDIRYSLLKSWWGEGYALEAARACMDVYFRAGMGDTVYGVAVRKNRASVRVLEKLGMRLETGIQLYTEEDLLTFSLKVNSRLSRSGAI